ncbi:MAG TPA: hypothetical protein VGG33_01925 [Polyangia bacterium]
MAGLALALAVAAGCATQDLSPPPSAAQITAAEAAVKVAREGGPVEGSAGQHLRMAEKQLADSKERARNGNNRAAGLLLARAEADAELSQVLRRREKAIADAEVIEGHLSETKTAAVAPTPAPSAVDTPPTFGATGTAAAPSTAAPNAPSTVPAPSSSTPTQPATPEWGRTPNSPLTPNPTTPTPAAP